MEYNLKIGGVGLHVISDYEFVTEQSFAPFLSLNPSERWVNMEFWANPAPLRQPQAPMLGRDLLLEYYQDAGGLLCASPGARGPLALTRCSSDYNHLVCRLNSGVYQLPMTLGHFLRMTPMRRVLQEHGVQLLHASQIAFGGRGILFTAPSGTGKTTQAKLWRTHRGAEIICNDRTLVRDGQTYGFPMDGSEPVCSGKILPLGAVVCLAQAGENRICRLRPGEALAALMPQVVFDSWDSRSSRLASEQLIELIRRRPVYQLCCTPDQQAVECLEACLRKDGILE